MRTAASSRDLTHGVGGRGAGVHERRGGRRIELRGHVNGLRGSHHEAFGEAACAPEHPCDGDEVLAQALIAGPAQGADAAAGEQRDGDPRAEPVARTVACGHDPPDGLVSQHEWKLWRVGQAGKDMQVGAADPAGLDRDDDLLGGCHGLRQLDLLEPLGRQRDDGGGSHAAGSAGGWP